MVENGHNLVIVHGNGPQVGMINQAFSIANAHDKNSPVVDFPECGSMSQGYIGFHLTNALVNEFKKRKMTNDVATIVTQTIVDKKDSAFKNPTKPIGMFYDQQQAEILSKTQQWDMKEDSGRGWRRVIASPKPIDIVEKKVITTLLEANTTIIAAGGGGIPVYLNQASYQGIAAVIDKDFAAAKIAEIIKADKLIILTAVDRVMINYNTENEEALEKLTVTEVEKLIAEKQFGEGSMLPKVQAAVSFIQNGGQESIIGSLEESEKVIQGLSGTRICKA
nr:carbamate kinase [Spiroplasma clarkii]